MKLPSQHSPASVRWLAILTLAALYAMTGRLGQMIYVDIVTAVWPPSGLALATLILLGRRQWPGIWLGSFVVNVWALKTLPNAFSRDIPTSLAIAALIGIGSSIQAVVAARFFRRFVPGQAKLKRVRDIINFLLISAGACLIAATLGTVSLCAGGVYDWASSGNVWTTWWLGDFSGIIIITPLILAWSHAVPYGRRRLIVEGSLMALMISGLSFVVFWGEFIPGVRRFFPLTYTFLPVVICAAFRLGMRGVTGTAFILSVFAISATSYGWGPLVRPADNSLLFLQAFVCIVTVTGLFLAAALEEQRRTQEKLRRANAFLDSVLENIPNMVFVKDAKDLRFVRFNLAGEELLGYSRHELLGKHDGDFFPREEADFFMAKDRQVLANHAVTEIPEEPIHTRNGQVRYLRTKKTAIRDSEGNPLYLLGVSEDITELRQTQLALRASEARLRRIVESNLIGLAFGKPDGIVTHANDAFLQLIGFSHEDVAQGRVNWRAITPSEHRRATEELLQQVQRGDTPHPIEKEYVRKDGSRVPILLGATLLDETTGEMAAFALDLTDLKRAEQALRQAHDQLEERVRQRTEELAHAIARLKTEIDERRKTEIALRESEERLVSLIENSPDAINLQDDGRRWLIANAAMLRMFRIVGADYRGKTASELALLSPLFAEALRNCERMDQIALESSKITRIEEIIPNADGTARIFDIIKAPIKNADGRLTGLVVIGRDITARKRDEERLKAALEEKEVLLKEIHHRVKNNLQIISSLLNLQASLVSEPRAGAILRDSRDRVRSMALLHEKLYQSQDLGRIDFGVYLKELTANLARAYVAEHRDITIRLDARNVYLDIHRAVPCALIVNELVINAIKHAFPEGRKGQIRIRMSRDRNASYRLRISDNGVGIPDDRGVRNATTLGLQLIEGLTRQLGGRLRHLKTRSGTAFELVFNHVRKTQTVRRAQPETVP